MTTTDVLAIVLSWLPVLVATAAAVVAAVASRRGETWAINARLAAVRAKKAATRAEDAVAPAIDWPVSDEPVGESTGKHALPECPVDGEPLIAVRREAEQPALLTHADGTTHGDRMTELSARGWHPEDSAMSAMDALITEARGSMWSVPIRAADPLSVSEWAASDDAFGAVDMSVQRGGIQYASATGPAETTAVIPVITDAPTGTKLGAITDGRFDPEYEVVVEGDLVPEMYAGRVAEPLREVDLPGVGRCEVLVEAEGLTPALVRQIKDES
jgi:hypothetical protein